MNLKLPFLATEIINNRNLIFLGKDLCEMYLCHSLYFDTIRDVHWKAMFFEAYQYQTLKTYFMSPIYHSFLLVENFHDAR